METSETTPSTKAIETRVLREGRKKAEASHHRLPQFYLRGWAGKNGRLVLLDPKAGTTRSTSPRAAFAEEGYYTIRVGDDEEPNALVEELYSAIENDAARVHQRLVEGISPAELREKEIGVYATFMAAQVTRGEEFREFDRQISDQLGKRLLKMRAARPREEWEHARDEALASGEEPPPEITPELRRLIEEDAFEIVHSPEMRSQLSLTGIPDLAQAFMQMSWHTAYFNEPCLITSEHPITYWRLPSPMDRFYGIGPATSDEVRFPLSPDAALILTHPKYYDAERRGHGSREAAAILNWWTCVFSGRTVVLCPDTKHHPLPLSRLVPGLTGRKHFGPIITE